jgi:beta-aspartyl-peptidase (threonine type)
MTPERESEYRAGLRAALDAGYAVLERGGSALDAVVAAVQPLEDNPLFNAGKGAVLNSEGFCEMDASIMEGRTLAAGAVAGVRHVKHPILLARAVMEQSPHVMCVGAGAEAFAKERGLELMPDDYFITEGRRRELQRTKESSASSSSPGTSVPSPSPQGTVGAVALDRHGHLAAATSTGGMTNKRFGRVGDSPIIGAGNYANDATCAVSATGHGEYFIRSVVAHDVSALMEYRGWPLEKACAEVLRKVGVLGGTGGLIAVDKAGNIALPFNTSGMYRAHRRSAADSEPIVEIFGSKAAAKKE